MRKGLLILNLLLATVSIPFSCKKEPEVIEVTSVTLNQHSVDMNVGGQMTLYASIQPENATNRDVSWSSSNHSIVSVSSMGNLTAYSKGAVTISASAGGQSDRCIVNVIVPVETVSINPMSVSLIEGETTALNAWITPKDANDSEIQWSSSNSACATVDQNGNVTAIMEGTATITAKAGDKTATCVITINPSLKAIDLGLSVKWANMNLGASRPEDYGDYFAWGETETKNEFSLYNYKWLLESSPWTKLSKYSKVGEVLELEDDAAHMILGENWRMPTLTELVELQDPENCTWEWTTINYKNGYKIRSNKNGYTDKWIFLPAAGFNKVFNTSGYGYYWSSTLGLVDVLSYHLIFLSNHIGIDSEQRWWGYSIRPVTN